MSARSGHDLAGLIKWARREEWRPRLEAVVAEHFAPAAETFRLSMEEIDAALGGNWVNTIWGCGFEDFLTRRFSPDQQNAVEAYLRSRGWKERVATRAYMTALQSSVMSLHEVSDVVPGQSLRARDLIRGGEPVLVSERSATQTLKEWDRIAARVVPRAGGMVLGGGVLVFPLEASQQLLAQLAEQVRPPPGRQAAGNRLEGALEGWHGSDSDLRRAAPLFSNAWLTDALPRALGTGTPVLLNSDGDEVLFHTVNFPLAPGAPPDEVERRLNALDQLQQESPVFWNWLGDIAPRFRHPKNQDRKALVWNTTMEDGTAVLGNVEVKDGVVALSVSSAARAERGSALVAPALGDLVGQPLTEIQTVEQVRAARATRQAEAAPVPAEHRTAFVHDTMDREYRARLDERIPMLGDITPRTAARSARGRKNLAIWLKQAENAACHAGDADDPMRNYDFTWLWRELGIEHLRK